MFTKYLSDKTLKLDGIICKDYKDRFNAKLIRLRI